MRLIHFLYSILLASMPGPVYGLVKGSPVLMTDPIATATAALAFKNLKNTYDFCSAVIIEQDVLLTVAHCVETQDPEVLLGTTILHKGSVTLAGERVQTKKIYPNKSYAAATDKQIKAREDVAMIHLAEPLPPIYKPVTLNLEDKLHQEMGKPLKIRVAGFGAQTPWGNKRKQFDGGAAEEIRLNQKVVEVTAMDPTVFKITDDTGVTCFGDSGGPAFAWSEKENEALVLEGVNITVGSADGALCGSTAFVLRLASKKDWILSTLEQIRTQRRPALKAETPKKR